MPKKLPLVAARTVPWSTTINILYFGGALPLEGATVRMQVRLYPGAPGSPLVDLGDIDFEDVPDATADSPTRRRLTLSPFISEANLEGFPTGLNEPEAGEADRFAYDIIIEYADGKADRPVSGDFLLEPGVTD